MQKGKMIYEGKAKIMYETEDPDLLIQYFKDSATAFDGVKKAEISQKGVVNNKISTRIFEYLASKGIKSHFVRQLSDREMLVKRLQIIPLEVVMRNVIAGSLAKRYGLPEGGKLKSPLFELYYKSDALHDPMLTEDHALLLSFAPRAQLRKIRELAFTVNKLLVKYFDRRNIILVDFKLEFGLHKGKTLLLGDEVSPDGCRLWDRTTQEKLDKDRFRRDLGGVEEAYQEVLKRVLS
jgi:phosphoribosylaminoimidazole-succinocarboxamide synthase